MVEITLGILLAVAILACLPFWREIGSFVGKMVLALVLVIVAYNVGGAPL